MYSALYELFINQTLLESHSVIDFLFASYCNKYCSCFYCYQSVHGFLFKELVWKVARYTSAAPMYFTECDNYMDGGVLANNPSLLAWAVIQKYHDHNQLPRPKVAMAVSLGAGVYPSQKLGETDILGKGLLNLRGTMRRAQRFIRMISTAVSWEGTDFHCCGAFSSFFPLCVYSW